MICGGNLFYMKFWIKLTALERDSAVTPNKKVQLTLIGSPLRAFKSAQDEHRTLYLSPQRVAQKRKVSKISTISCDNSETVEDSRSVTINH